MALTYKKFHDTRLKCQARVAGQFLALAGKEIEVILESGATHVILNLSAGVQLESGGGNFSYLVTVANLATLGDPTQVKTAFRVWNADNTLALAAQATVDVTL
jgi:hypothetical protein